jgi:hypothetical protein
MTTVVVTQPQQVKHDMMVASLQGHRDWTTGLFECFQDMGVCKLSAWLYGAVGLVTYDTYGYIDFSEPGFWY